MKITFYCMKIRVFSQKNHWNLFVSIQLTTGLDSRNNAMAISSCTILWSWSADRIPQTPIKIGSSDRENMKPSSLLPFESWCKSFTGEFRTEITRLWLNEKRQTDVISSWHHNGRHGNVIYVYRYESVTVSSVHTHSVVHDTTQLGHAMFDRYVSVVDIIGIYTNC